MGLKVEPAYIGQTGFLHPVELDRNLLEGLFQRSGAFRLGEFQASTGVGTRAIAVSAGRAFVLGVENATQGGYFAWSDAIETFLLAAGVGNPRIDTILLRIIDDQYGTISGVPRAEFEVVQGVAAGSPVARVDSDFNVGGSFYKPGAWWRVADCRVNVGDTTIPTGQITTNNRYVRTPGGVTICGSTSRPTDPVLGDVILETDTKLRYWYDGTWRMLPSIIAETVLGASSASVTISNIPTSIKTLRVHWMARSDAAAGGYDMNVRVNSVSTTSYFGLYQTLNNATNAGANAFGVAQARIGVIPGNVSPATKFGIGTIDINGWNRSGGLMLLGQGGFYDSAANSWLEHSAWMFDPAGPYTALRFHPGSGNFVAGSTFTVEALA